MKLLQRFKTLPVSTKRLLSLSVVLGLFVALPLLIWAIVTQTFLFRERAATGEPGQNVAVNIVTPSVVIRADDFKLVSNGHTYTAGQDDINVSSSYTSDNQGATTIVDINTTQQAEPLGARIVFRTNYTDWWVTEVTNYDPSYAQNLVTFSGTHLLTPYGQTRDLTGTFTVDVREPVSHDFISQVTFTNLHIEAFANLTQTPGPQGCNQYFLLGSVPNTVDGQTGQTKRFNITVENTNPASCGNYTSHLIIDKPSNWDAVFGQADFTIAGGQTFNTTLDITTPADNFVLGWQELPIRLSTERFGNLGNDRIYYHLESQMSEADLAVTDITLQRSVPPQSQCESYVYSVTVKNVGTEPAFKTRMQTYIDPAQPQTINGCSQANPYSGSNSPVPNEESVNFLNPGESITYSDYFNPSAAGEVIIRGFADEGGILTEHNEGNNYMSKKFNVVKIFPSPTPTPGDVNGDGIVNIVDIGIIIDNYRMDPPANPEADLNGDGIINIIDIGIVVDNYQF